MHIRFERPADADEIRAVNASAFGTAAEADLVEVLRRVAFPLISLVAEQDDTIAGHILFSPVTLSSDPSLRIAGLAPILWSHGAGADVEQAVGYNALAGLQTFLNDPVGAHLIAHLHHREPNGIVPIDHGDCVGTLGIDDGALRDQ